jgi:hypothetical protein
MPLERYETFSKMAPRQIVQDSPKLKRRPLAFREQRLNLILSRKSREARKSAKA